MVGSNGAGNATLADIILGSLSPENGTLRADGQIINDNSLRAWQRTLGYVPQDIFLMDTSLSQNIAFGLSPRNIDDAKVERAARIARPHKFVTKELPSGDATHIRHLKETGFEPYMSIDLSEITRRSLHCTFYQINFAFAKNDAAFCQRAWA
jgi:ABC-type bacteriocin/lantibiotic exporter with double-glycine peptidase domain